MDKLKNLFTLQWGLSGFGIFALFFTLGFGAAGWPLMVISGILIILMEYLFTFRDNKWLTPYMFMILSPLLLIHYSSITDFRIRAVCFVFFIYIFNAAYTGKVKKIKFSLVNAKAWKIWLTAFMIFSMVSTVVYLQGLHLSGDEPHYLMITQSLVEDGDFDLKNNMDNKTYLDYIPVEVRFHGGEYEGKYLSFHLPGMSFLMLPFYLLFKALGGAVPAALYFRLAASVINAFFALALFYVLRITFVGRNITGLWLLFLSIYPLVFHSVHLYPELPAAALMAAAYFNLVSPRRNILLMGLFLAMVPWFHVKYIPPLLVLTPAILYDLLKPFKPFRLDKERVRRLLHFFVFPLFSMVLLVLYCKILYNSYSPTNIFPKESYWTVPFMLRLKVFAAYFLDQRDGLLFYSPLLFLSFWAFRKKFTGRGLLLGMALSYVGFHAFTSVRGAYSPAGRPLMFVSWILIIFTVHFYFNILREHPQPMFRYSFRALAGLGVFVTVWLFYYPLFLYQPVFAQTVERASGFNRFFGGSVIPLWDYFPSFLTSPNSGHPANFVWLGLLAVLSAYYYFRPLKRAMIPRQNLRKEILTVVLFLGISFLYCFYPHVHLLPRNKYTAKTVSFFNNSKNFRHVEEPNGFRVKGGNTYDIFLDRKMPLNKRLTFRFDQADGMDVTVRNGKKILFQSSQKKSGAFILDTASLRRLAVGGRSVSHLGIETRTRRRNAFLRLTVE